MTDTPRTDAAELKVPHQNATFTVVRSFEMRKLERELAAAKAHIEKLNAAQMWLDDVPVYVDPKLIIS